MKYSDYLLEISEAQKQYCLSLKFPEDDVRTDFHGMVYDVTYNFYCGHVAYELGAEIRNGNVMFNEKIIDSKNHIDRLTEVVKVKMLTTSYLSALNKHFAIGVWTAFELSVTVMASTLLNDNDKQELLGYKSDEIINILKNKGLDTAILDKVSKKLTDNHITHVPLSRKFRKVLSLYDGKYKRNLQDDLRFIEFYGKMRNTLVHSNGIYYGKQDEYKFKDYVFRFENGKIFTYTNDQEMPPRLYVELASNLSSIYIALTDLLTDIKEIKYPVTGIYWEE